MLSLRAKLIRCFGPFAVCAALFLVAGGHWGALQTVAWAGMLWNYTQEDGSLASGAKRTFSGEGPCSMCRSIKAAKDKERSEPVVVASVKKIEAFPSPLCAVLPSCPCFDFEFPRLSDLFANPRPHAPAVPVPIGISLA